MSQMIIIGASSGLGLGLAEGFPAKGDRVWLVSRKRPRALDRSDGVDRQWIEANLASPDGIEDIARCVKNEEIDLMIFCAGTWESDRDITKVGNEQIYNVLAVNTSAFIAVAKTLAPNLRSSDVSRIVAIGSTAGLENATGSRAAYAASKFGLRGAVHSLRELFRVDRIGVTIISPGGIASDVSFDEGKEAALLRYRNGRIPCADFIIVLRMLMDLSPATCVKEIDMPAMLDTDA